LQGVIVIKERFAPPRAEFLEQRGRYRRVRCARLSLLTEEEDLLIMGKEK